MATTGPRKFSMSDVKARMGNYASTNFYHVYFKLPSKAEQFVKSQYSVNTSQAIDLVEIACIDTSLPGSSFATHEITNDFYGITERHAYRRQFDGRIDFTFAVDRNYTLLRLFEGWMGYVGGETTPGYQNSTTKTNGYKVPFKEDYACDNLTIVKYEKDSFRSSGSQRVIQYNFLNAFPVATASIPVSQGPTDFLTMTVSMDYQKYYTSAVDTPTKLGVYEDTGVQGYSQYLDGVTVDSTFGIPVSPLNDTSFTA